ncbi:basement membrane-specific heparan sulfate proteoglycan core protein isoform X3 [Sitophilus oryzae]|uniref:Basement membrane-specific heparan sulfate proteoglycan core protein isoform X3 n=1 Tax=Sitophilus oryzae TaxID=7048 RepID=A0A6J2X1M1_SITOR|nr:basement membrane-specific heparan sulfate proteoglycan core protein isoform X3 [Sitophilus oryzae]
MNFDRLRGRMRLVCTGPALVLMLVALQLPRHVSAACQYNEFDCGNGQCIPDVYRCSGAPECSNGRDETNCPSRSHNAIGACSFDEFECSNGECIPKSKQCDREYDCSDQSDERSCPCRKDDFHCNNGFCIPPNQRCDGIRQCQDQSDEIGCKTIAHCLDYQWKCNNGQCIDRIDRCNSRPNCEDESDERNCYCSKDEFRCNNGSCIALNKRCNGEADCENQEDEENCACGTNDFKCKNGLCIPELGRCNGSQECSDGSDELGCTAITPHCGLGYWRCDDGNCIKTSKVCNGIADCIDKSDESLLYCWTFEKNPDTTHYDCGPNGFDCKNDICIHHTYRCDGYKDCPDGSDELGCNRTSVDTEQSGQCAPDEVRCRDRSCIKGKRCDRVYDCVDGTDEVDCEYCTSGEFQCRSGGCIDERLRCDGLKDCQDGSDEEGCHGVYPERCLDNEIDCGDGQCVSAHSRCNGVRDCANGRDEEGCPVTTTSRPCSPYELDCGNGQCIDIRRRCDGYRDCPNNRDEEACPTTTTPRPCSTYELDCGNGHCIDIRRRCDGYPDCPNNRDEEGCLQRKSCSNDEFDCGDGVCVDINRRCDGQRDCSTNKDEEGCPEFPPLKSCPPDKFNCGDGLCIDESFKCDGVPDCQNSTDEADCACQSDEFRCRDGQCIPQSRRCDRYSDCVDGSDESGCTGIICPNNQFKCEREDRCIPDSRLCDRNPDCSDGSDERNCPCSSDEFGCSDGQCIDNRLKCDGRPDCRDRSDEYNCVRPTPKPVTLPPDVSQRSCPPFYINCVSGDDCILRSQLCDGHVDCRDLSDENNCDTSAQGLQLKTYPNQQEIRENKYKLDREVVFQCRDEGPIRAEVEWRRANGQPLPPGSKDNHGRLEIPDIKVEHAGTYVCVARGFPPGTPGAELAVQLYVDKAPPPYIAPTVKCYLNESTCANGDCIPRNKVCDGEYDCTDGSDEIRCSLKCEPNEFKCDNKKCIHKSWVCDAQDDCGDDSDEKACRLPLPGEGCGPNQFTCRSGQCIPRSFQCDGSMSDCTDRSDEIGCIRPVISEHPIRMVRLSVGSLFQITCRAVGIPVPEIIWRLNWRHVPSTCRSTSVNGLGTLICENIQVEDQGAYTCEAISTLGSEMSSDTILEVYQQSVCRPGYFNTEARQEGECIKCFCFGHATNCRSADLFIFQFQPPFDSLKLLGARIDPYTGVVDIRDEPIYKGVEPQLIQIGSNGVKASLPYYAELNQPNVVPYFSLPENYHGNQLKSYGGYLQYNVHHSNDGRPITGPDVILTGNNYILLHQAASPPPSHRTTQVRVRFFDGDWVIKSDREPERLATREEIMMALEDVTNILIKLEYNEGLLNTSLTSITMDSAGSPDRGFGAANYVEQCSCPVGYTGTSCEYCDEGYTRHISGPWLGQCYREPPACPPGSYYDGRECQICPCPYTSPSNQFARTCHLGSDGNVVCDCQVGYIGVRCEQCAPGYVGNPLTIGDSCRPAPVSRCDPVGTLGQDADGRCLCKAYTTGLYCNKCKEKSFYLSAQNQFGCIACFCMGVTQECSSSHWYRDTIHSVLTTNTVADFKLTDINKLKDITEGITLNRNTQEISYASFSQPDVYYWSLPSKYLGDKVTSYGGYLTYTIRNTPVPGGASSRNNAPDVELVSDNHINLLHYSSNKSQSTNAPQTFVVPLLEQYWQRNDGLKTDREHLLMALADVQAIYIKATYFTNTQEAALISVSLDTATEQNTGLSRAWEVEQCQCPVGYTGLSCEDCAFGYTRSEEGIYLELCMPCECNGFSNECDSETGICRNCRDNTDGDSCEQCLPGYSGDPTRGQPCRYIGPVEPCNCDPRGTTYAGCVNGACQCKSNVEGRNCDRCKNGTFGLSEENIEGCEFCFCSGESSECTESRSYIEQIPVQIVENHGFILTDQYFRKRIESDFKTSLALNEIGYNFPPSQRDTLYWSLPSTFTGNQIKSYGGKLEYMQRYIDLPDAKYTRDKDIIIKGNNIVISWTNPNELKPEKLNSISARLHPRANWYRLDQNKESRPASREDILTVLANIESILIRATLSTDTSSTFLSDISLDTAVDVYNGKQRAINIEICRCPQGYRGTSCESCSVGYYKDLSYSSTNPLGTCRRCPCNSREESCQYAGAQGVICNCLPGFYGRTCESISPGPIIDIGIEITPPRVVAPVGFQQEITCRYRTKNVIRNYDFLVRNLNTSYETRLTNTVRFKGGAQASFYSVVGCTEQTYQCVIVTKEGYKIGAVNVVVKPAELIPIDPGSSGTVRPPEPPTIDVVISGHRLEIYEIGSSVRLNCSAVSRLSPKGPVRVSWTKDSGELPYHAIDDGRGILYIRNLAVSDSGRYTCQADDGYSIVAQSISITVGDVRAEAPIIALSAPFIQVSEGQLIEVRCAATGNPLPEYSLSRIDRQPINPAHQFDLGVFRILQARTTDAGHYQCTATNRAGQDSKSFEIQVTAGSVLRVEITPEYYEGKTGDNVVLRCIADRARSISWSKEFGSFPYTSRDEGGLLTFSNIQPEDSGVYICTATSYDGTRGTQTVTVNIARESGSYPTARLSQDRFNLRQGDSAQIVCEVTGYPTPTVKWSRAHGALSPNFEQIGNTLHIRNAHIEDRGLYLCVADNGKGVDQAVATVEVTRFETPLISLYPEGSLTVTAGNTAQLQCRATQGYPSPTITWSRVNNIPFNPNVEVMSGGNLKIVGISRAEAGDYLCTATNEAGTAKATATISVISLPELYVTPGDSVITKAVNEYLRLECRGIGVPDPQVFWNKAEYGYSRPAYVQGATGNVAVQEFSRIRLEDSGTYICAGVNDAGRSETRVQLNVLPERGDNPGRYYPGGDSPSQTEEFTAIAGARAQLHCKVTASDNVQHQVDWIRSNNGSLPESSYITDGTLYIDNVQPSAAGDYECVVYALPSRNIRYRIFSRLNVISPPRISLYPAKQVVEPGDNAYIQCSATGDQPIDIQWYPVNRTMPASVYTRDGYIRFSNIHQDDAGKYRCAARNSAGEADSVAEVVVAFQSDRVLNPVIEAENHLVTSTSGSTVTLRCKAGSEQARVQWRRDGAPIPPNSEISGSNLVLYDLSRDYEGRYYCDKITENGVGSDFIDLRVVIHHKECLPGWWRCGNGNCISPQLICDGTDDCHDNSDESSCQVARTSRGPPLTKSLPSNTPALHISPSQTEYDAGETVDLNCQSNEPGVIPTWSKLSGGLAENVQNRAGRLRINNVRADNEGVYRCEATGQRGTYYKDLTLYIRDNESRDEIPIKVQRAKRTASVLLVCDTDLEEPVSYYWSKQGGTLPHYVDEYNKQIQLNSIGAIDAGTYICSATSQSRTIDTPIILVVTGIIPYFTQAPNSYISLPTLPEAYLQFSFDISFKPENDHGLIVYNGNREKDKDGDFISLALDNSYPEFKFNLGPGTTTTTVRASEPITKREWHTIKVVRNRKRVILFVDGKGPYIGENDGKYFGLDLSGSLYLGGVPDYNIISEETMMDRGFVGCISKFKIGYTYQDILQEALNSTGLTNCETCTESRCENQGACQEALTTEGYTCICPAGFSGPTCNKRKGEACSPYSCGVGRCVDTENGFECQCPLGRGGKYCEKTIQVMEPAFSNNAYIAYPPLKPLRRTKIEMKIKPRDTNDGVLLYAAETNEGHGDFISLSIKDRHLEFRFDNGQGPYIIRSDHEIVPNQWSAVLAIKSLLDGRIVVDGRPSAPTKVTGNYKALTLLTPVYIGGFDKYNVKLNKGVKVDGGFNGCISDINISGLDDAMLKNITDSSNVEDCAGDDDIDNNIYSPQYAHENQYKPLSYDSKKTGCSDNPCRNNAPCIPLSPVDYKCSCPAGFTGKTCEVPVDLCENRPCQHRGVCRSNSTGFTCDCPLGYSGHTCEQRTELRNDANFNGNGFLEFSKSLLSHIDNEPETIALEFSTNKSEGLLFWHGQYPHQDGRDQDYISLAVVNGYLEYSYDLGEGPAIIRVSQIRVDDGQRHSVILKRHGRSGSIDVDHLYTEEGESEGYTSHLSTNGNIYLGGAPNISLLTGNRFSKGFDGCIHGFEIQQSKTIDLGVKAINGLNVKPCSSFSDIDNNIWND